MMGCVNSYSTILHVEVTIAVDSAIMLCVNINQTSLKQNHVSSILHIIQLRINKVHCQLYTSNAVVHC